MKNKYYSLIILTFMVNIMVFNVSCDNGTANDNNSGKFQIRISGISNNDMNLFMNNLFSVNIHTEQVSSNILKTIAGFSSSMHAFETGGSSNNQWISFEMHNVTPNHDGSYTLNEQIYFGKEGYYFMTLLIHNLNIIDGKLEVEIIKNALLQNVKLEINNINNIQYNSFIVF